jgi:FkbM family methyltransferase
VDCGAYNGDTVMRFIKYSHGKYKKIVAFEPDASNVRALKKRGKNISVVQAACWSSDTELSFETDKGSSSKVVENKSTYCDIKVVAKAIDSVNECKDATFIKMDIEGSEYDALIGAYNTICRNTPKLAICIYHSDEDMLRILELIESWNLGYKFYVRHHAQKISETVLYAIK